MTYIKTDFLRYLPSALGLVAEGDINVELREISQTLPVTRAMDRGAVRAIFRSRQTHAAAGVLITDFDPTNNTSYAGVVVPGGGITTNVAVAFTDPLDYVILGIGIRDDTGAANTIAATAGLLFNNATYPTITLFQAQAMAGTGASMKTPKVVYNRCPYFYDHSMASVSGTNKLSISLAHESAAASVIDWYLDIIAAPPGILPVIP